MQVLQQETDGEVGKWRGCKIQIRRNSGFIDSATTDLLFSVFLFRITKDSFIYSSRFTHYFYGKDSNKSKYNTDKLSFPQSHMHKSNILLPSSPIQYPQKCILWRRDGQRANTYYFTLVCENEMSIYVFKFWRNTVLYGCSHKKKRWLKINLGEKCARYWLRRWICYYVPLPQ